MYHVQVHKLMNRIISLLYRVHFWSREDNEPTWERGIKLFYSIYYLLFAISLMAGALASDSKGENIFLFEVSLIVTVLLVKIWLLTWEKKNFLLMFNEMCVYSIDDHKTFTFVESQINIFVQCATFFLGSTYLAAIATLFLTPFMEGERKLFLNVGFPLDYKNDTMAFWTAFTFVSTEVILSAVSVSFSVLIWYSMFHCGLRYVVLGEKFKNLGAIKRTPEILKKRKVTNSEKDILLYQDLHEVIIEHKNLRESTHQLNKFLSKVFVVQLATSALSICGSVYCIAFNRGANLIETTIHSASLVYSIFEIFMVSYFGNEIKLASNRLSYSLFESDWCDRCLSLKKEILRFGEFFMKPVDLVILKIYSLTLVTFTRIIKSAYSTFNILKNFK